MVRKISALFVACVLLFSSCLDTEEKIVINKDNSGDYTLTLDMSKLMTMMDQMGGIKDSAKVLEKKDSTLYFKPYVDTSTALTAKEKEMFRDGSLRIKANEEAKEMKVFIHFPFKNISQLPELRSSYIAVIDKLGLSKKMNNDNQDDNASAENMDVDFSKNKNMLSPTQEAYSFTASPGKIANTLTNKQLITDKILKDSTMQMMQQMSLIMGEMNYKTIIILPKAVKKYTANQTILSADKKTLTFLNTFNDMISKPESAAYSVEY
ncbi:MAG: hypothetical protein QM802_13815 [Agriterribacter sp.]